MSTQESGNSQQAFPSLCKNGCGFFGRIENKGFCSVCYKENLKKEAAEEKRTEASEVEAESTAEAALASLSLEDNKEEESKVTEAAADVTAEPLPSTDGAAADSAAVSAEAEKKDEDKKDTKKKKNRCFVCKKKLGLTGFTCRCGRLFCAVHRYTDKHDCSFDYKAMGEKEISEANPVIVAAKLNKI